jgi:hypothetical protein
MRLSRILILYKTPDTNMASLFRIFIPWLLVAAPAMAQNSLPVAPTRPVAASAAPATASAAPVAAPTVLSARKVPLLLATEQWKDRLMIIDPESREVVWEWIAPDDPDIPAERKKWFTNPSDAKATSDKKTILFSCSGGAVGALDVKTKKLIWYTCSGSNPHSIEPLPDGNVATASSNGNFVKVIPSTGQRGYIDSTRFIKDTLTTAHNVVWDRKRGLLWSAGLLEIIACKYAGGQILPGDRGQPGGQAPPGLQEVVRIRLPDPDGHDLIQLDDSTLLLSTDHNIWLFNTGTGVFSVYTGCVPHKGIKSISFSGKTAILVYPNQVWWSDRVYNCDGSVLYQLDKARFYKVRFF